MSEQLDDIKHFVRKKVAYSSKLNFFITTGYYVFRKFCRRCSSLHDSYTISFNSLRSRNTQTKFPVLSLCERCAQVEKEYQPEPVRRARGAHTPDWTIYDLPPGSQGPTGARAYPCSNYWPSGTSGRWDNAVRALEDG